MRPAALNSHRLTAWACALHSRMDAWTYALALLTGTLAVRALRWPPDRCRLIVAADPDDLPRGASDALVAEFIADAGSTTASALAAALAVSRQAAHQRLQRMHAAGMVRRDGMAWNAAGLKLAA